MSDRQPSPAVSYSIASLSGSSQQLFPDVPAPTAGSFQERWVSNPNAANSIWINLFGAAAVANGAGSMEIKAGGFWSGAVSSQINVIGTAADKVTAGQR